jgi:hypothetical protein
MVVRFDHMALPYMNAIRRTVLSDVPVVCFRTAPVEATDCAIQANTSGTCNDVVKQRLSCVPICLFRDPRVMRHFGDYVLRIDVTNDAPLPRCVTTEDFVVVHKTTGDRLATDDLFPPFVFEDTAYYVDFLVLPPRLTDRKAARIELTCSLSMGTALECGKFNAVSACTVTGVVDEVARDVARQAFAVDHTAMEVANWDVVEAPRHVVAGSYLLAIETVGAYRNSMVLRVAMTVLRTNFVKLVHQLKATLCTEDPTPHAYHVIMPGCSNTEGNVLSHEVYQKYFVEGSDGISFVAFRLLHPHDGHGVLKVVFTHAPVDVVGTISRVVEERVIPKMDTLIALL